MSLSNNTMSLRTDGRRVKALAALIGSACLSKSYANDYLNHEVVRAFDFASTQLRVLAEDVLVDSDVFADYTDEEGLWQTDDKTVWTSGMTVGLFWYQYEYTGEEIWKEYGEKWLEGLEGVEGLDDNDVGFQVYNSFGLAYRLTGESSYKDTVLDGAETLYDLRYMDNVPAYYSWANPSRRPEWERAVNVDMIMNMEIMLWASANGDTDYTDSAIGHSDTTWKDIVRDDNSTFHVADYDPDTGDLVDQGTYQGWQDNSTWSRGQAWAIHGFIMVYRYTKEPRYIDYSLGTLQYFLDNLPDDNVPHSDFDAPLDEYNLKDSSSTAIVASALLELFWTLEDPYYLEKAQEFLISLFEGDGYYLPSADDGWQSILRRVTSEHGDPETGSIFGDYYLLETMIRYVRMAPSILLRDEGERSISRKNNAVVTYRGSSLVDVELSGLNTEEDVKIWFAVTLSNESMCPYGMVFYSCTGERVEVELPNDFGCMAGMNKKTLSVPAGTFKDESWQTVSEMSILFKKGDGDDSKQRVTVDWLVLGHDLAL